MFNIIITIIVLNKNFTNWVANVLAQLCTQVLIAWCNWQIESTEATFLVKVCIYLHKVDFEYGSISDFYGKWRIRSEWKRILHRKVRNRDL